MLSGQEIRPQAQQVVESNPQWYSGQTRVVWEGNAHKVTISEHGRDGGGLATLRIRNGKAGESVQCGHLDPAQGWVWTLSRSEYESWVERARGV